MEYRNCKKPGKKSPGIMPGMPNCVPAFRHLKMKNFIEESDEHEEIIKTVKPDCRREIPEGIPQIERHEVSHVAFPGMAQSRRGDQGQVR